MRTAAKRINNRIYRTLTSLIVSFVACVMAVSIAVSIVAANNRPSEGFSTVAICVMEGDSLWSLGTDHPISGMSLYECMSWIESTNNLKGSVLRPGQVLVVPA